MLSASNGILRCQYGALKLFSVGAFYDWVQTRMGAAFILSAVRKSCVLNNTLPVTKKSA